MIEYEKLLDKQTVLIRDLRGVLAQRDAAVKLLKTHISEQKELITDFRVQIETYEGLLDEAKKRLAYQPRRSRSYNANFWPRLNNHNGPIDTGWDDEHRGSRKDGGEQGSLV